ncbi:MAG: penicillin-binding protein 1C [Vicingaceae bacterium]|nr:MAG: penicillin-binding protein 1C [Vicingaceae bacterium]
MIILFFVWFYFLLPDPLFSGSFSTTIFDCQNKLIGAKIASDQQWRFPPSGKIPEKFRVCLLQFEDEYFYFHPGINPVSLFKALSTNLMHGEIKRGGSTITMQLARLVLKNKERTVWNKMKEIFLALRLELSFTKNKILMLYTSHAPFGGNIVGLDAAAWRYFGRNPEELSWGECATLAVLPNAPGLIHPGKNRELLYKKRNKLLRKLFSRKIIDRQTYLSAITEEIPNIPKKLPALAPHLLETIHKKHKGEKIITTINSDFQKAITGIVNQHMNTLKNNRIFNAAALVADIRSGEILAYVGNVYHKNGQNGENIDMITVPRSTGSILKPLLYALAYDEGLILPGTLLKDAPVMYKNFRPQNFDRSYRGAIPAQDALSMSLNIPAVILLRSYGIQKFTNALKKLKISSIKYPASHYGLSIILGGAEISLWEAVNLYAFMGSSLNLYFNHLIPDQKNYASLTYFKKSKDSNSTNYTNPALFIGVDALWTVFNGLSQKNRPIEGDRWQLFESHQQIAWKTGTSFGFRDAWCIGLTSKYVVGIWVGNASNVGRDGLTGIDVAAPIMFDVFNILPRSKFFIQPYKEMKLKKVCAKSGYLAGDNCEETKNLYLPKNAEKTDLCPYHIPIYLNENLSKRVHIGCYDPQKAIRKNWFVLPADMAYYYKKNHPDYKDLPPWDDKCWEQEELSPIRLIYPSTDVSVYLPVDIDGKKQKIIFKAAHLLENSELFWFIDNVFIGKTKNHHELSMELEKGMHTLTLVDNYGNSLQKRINAFSK